MSITLVSGSLNISRAQNHGQVSGRLVSDSNPLPEGTIAFFDADKESDPADRTIHRVPERTAMVDELGRFAVQIQYGRYLLGYFPGKYKVDPGLPDSSFTPSMAGTGTGDYIVHVASAHIETGDIAMLSVEESTPGPSFRVQGTVTSEKGKPLAGMTIVAKEDMQTFRPQYISRKTDKSGMYSIILPPGRYYLFARHRLQSFGRPVKGEYFGILGVDGPAGEFGWFPISRDTDIALQGTAGQVIDNADITVFRIPDPTTQEQMLRAKAKEKK